MADLIKEEKLSGVTGGLRNTDKLEAYIRKCKKDGKDINEILRQVMFQPMCEEFLYPVYEDGEVVGLTGAGDLYEYTQNYYNSI